MPHCIIIDFAALKVETLLERRSLILWKNRRYVDRRKWCALL